MAAKVYNNVAQRLNKEIGPALRVAVRDGVIKASEFAAGELRRSIKAKLKTRTGGLQRSFKATLLRNDTSGRVAGGAFSDSSYARVQDEGGTIRPKNRKALAVPVSQKAKRTVGLWPRHWAEGQLKYVPRKGKPPLLVESLRTRSIVHYVLMRSVTIKGSDYIGHARLGVKRYVLPLFKDKVRLAINKGGA